MSTLSTLHTPASLEFLGRFNYLFLVGSILRIRVELFLVFPLLFRMRQRVRCPIAAHR